MAAAPQIASYQQTYTTFSGADIVASFGGTVIGACSGITWSVSREKAPIYTMGSANPRSFSRGKRGIAGSLMFTVFDRPALYNMLSAQQTGGGTSIYYYTRTSNVLPGFAAGGNQVNHQGIVPVDQQVSGVTQAFPYYSDQIPPFDVTITFANEYGQAAVRSIYGVEMLNEGSGVSMDDIVLEESMTFICRELGPMIATTRDFSSAVSGFNTTVAPF